MFLSYSAYLFVCSCPSCGWFFPFTCFLSLIYDRIILLLFFFFSNLFYLACALMCVNFKTVIWHIYFLFWWLDANVGCAEGIRAIMLVCLSICIFLFLCTSYSAIFLHIYIHMFTLPPFLVTRCQHRLCRRRMCLRASMWWSPPASSRLAHHDLAHNRTHTAEGYAYIYCRARKNSKKNKV